MRTIEDYNATTRNGHQLKDVCETRDKDIVHKKRVFVDMDNVLVDFESGLAQISDEIKKLYEGRLDEIPGLFGLMKPMPGAIEAMHELQPDYLNAEDEIASQ